MVCFTGGVGTNKTGGSAKTARAAQTSKLYGWLDAERDLRDSHVRQHARLTDLEAEQTTGTPESGDSPNRLDALHHALKHLLPDAFSGRTTDGGYSTPRRAREWVAQRRQGAVTQPSRSTQSKTRATVGKRVRSRRAAVRLTGRVYTPGRVRR